MLKHILRAGEVNLNYARKLVADVPDEKMCLQPFPGMNHAAWVLGHLAYVFDSMCRVYGLAPTFPAEWAELFKVGSQPLHQREKYPSKEALWEAYERNYRRFVDAVASVDAAKFDEEFPNPRLRELMPTVGVGMVHVLCTHHGMHLGQLSAWRRALGMPSVL